MNNKLEFGFFVDKENKTITVRREFAAETALVWNAYTQAEILDQWWAPKPWKAKTKIMDFKEGGHWHYAMLGPEGDEHWALMNYIRIQNQKQFTGIDAFTNANADINQDLPQSNWEVNFNSQGQVTVVEINILYPDLAQMEAIIQMGFKEGLTMAMDNLDELLLTLKQS